MKLKITLTMLLTAISMIATPVAANDTNYWAKRTVEQTNAAVAANTCTVRWASIYVRLKTNEQIAAELFDLGKRMAASLGIDEGAVQSLVASTLRDASRTQLAYTSNEYCDVFMVVWPGYYAKRGI
jgi:hypothetical protein